MSKHILAVGNGDELLEQVNGRVLRHVYDERSGRYIAIQEDGASAYAARLRKVGICVNDPARFEQAAAQLDNHYESVAHADPFAFRRYVDDALEADHDATMNAAAGRYGY